MRPLPKGKRGKTLCAAAATAASSGFRLQSSCRCLLGPNFVISIRGVASSAAAAAVSFNRLPQMPKSRQMASQTERKRGRGGVGRSRQQKARGEERERGGAADALQQCYCCAHKTGQKCQASVPVCVLGCVCMCVCVCVTDCSVLAGGSSMNATRFQLQLQRMAQRMRESKGRERAAQ